MNASTRILGEQAQQRSATADLDVVAVRSDAEQVERFPGGPQGQ
jgi:hypothetical protein